MWVKAIRIQSNTLVSCIHATPSELGFYNIFTSNLLWFHEPPYGKPSEHLWLDILSSGKRSDLFSTSIWFDFVLYLFSVCRVSRHLRFFVYVYVPKCVCSHSQVEQKPSDVTLLMKTGEDEVLVYKFSISIAKWKTLLNKILFSNFDTEVWAALPNRNGIFFCRHSIRMKTKIYVCSKLSEIRAFDVDIHTFCANAEHCALHQLPSAIVAIN